MDDRVSFAGYRWSLVGENIAQGWIAPEFGFWLDSTAQVEIKLQGRITALPLVPRPEPGMGSTGCRIISGSFTEDNYSLLQEAPVLSRQDIKIWAAEPGGYSVEGAEIKSIAGNIISLLVTFETPGDEVSQKQIWLRRVFKNLSSPERSLIISVLVNLQYNYRDHEKGTFTLSINYHCN